jgi:hypothetical protein
MTANALADALGLPERVNHSRTSATEQAGLNTQLGVRWNKRKVER